MANAMSQRTLQKNRKYKRVNLGKLHRRGEGVRKAENPPVGEKGADLPSLMKAQIV